MTTGLAAGTLGSNITTTRSKTGTLKSNANDRTHEVNIRKTPDGEIKATRLPGLEVYVNWGTVNNHNCKWYHILYDKGNDDVGWVREDVITLTLLRFDITEGRHVRIFQDSEPPHRDSGQLYMNIYNPTTDETQLYKSRAVRLPLEVTTPPNCNCTVQWESFVAEENGKVYTARFVYLDQIEFVVSSAINGQMISRECGRNGTGLDFEEGEDRIRALQF